MSRDVKRVPLDFDWPLKQRWAGYLKPGHLIPPNCKVCEQPSSFGPPRGDGLSPAARAIDRTFYPHMIGGDRAQELAWHDKIGQAEVDNLVAHHRLDEWNLFDRVALAEPRMGEDGDLIRYELVRNSNPWPAADEVNARANVSLMLHDAINQGILVRFRCQQLGIPLACVACEGRCNVEAYPGQYADSDAWEHTEPPTGDGWQLWETVSEGSPVSPVFSTAEELAEWLTTPDGGRASGPSRQPMTIDQALAFINVSWAPTMIGTAGGLHDGAEYVGTQAVLQHLDPAGDDT